MNQSNDFLCKGIALSSLTRENKGGWSWFIAWVIKHAVVEIQNLKDIKQLTLICMEAFYLRIKDGIGIHLNTSCLLDVCSKTLFFFSLCSVHLIQELSIVLKSRKLLKFIGIIKPAGTDSLSNKLCVSGISLCQEATVADAVSLVIKYFWTKLVEILQNTLLQNVCVQVRDTINRVAKQNREVSHTNGVIPQHSC